MEVPPSSESEEVIAWGLPGEDEMARVGALVEAGFALGMGMGVVTEV